MTKMLFFCFLNAQFCKALLMEAPETLLPPRRQDFIEEIYYKKASLRYAMYGHWNT